MTLDLRSVAYRLNGEVSGGQVIFPPPGHSPRDRSACLRFDPNAPGGFVVHSFAGDDPLPIRDYVKERLALTFGRGIGPALSTPALTPLIDETERTTSVLEIWKEARGPRGTPVQVYLGFRGLDLPEEAAGEAIRYHSECPFAGKRVPAMVCLVRDVVTNVPKAIHRTALTKDGHKVKIDGKDRLALGQIAGGAIKLTPDEAVTTCLGIGEGIESTLSLRLAPEFGPSPVWSLISAGGIATLPALSGIECLWIAVDHDPAGVRAAGTCAERWRRAGREAFLVKPLNERSDLNDNVKGRERHA